MDLREWVPVSHGGDMVKGAVVHCFGCQYQMEVIVSETIYSVECPRCHQHNAIRESWKVDGICGACKRPLDDHWKGLSVCPS